MNGVVARAKEGEGTYDDIDYKKKMGDSLRKTPMPKQRESSFGRASPDKEERVLLQIPELVTPLRDDPE